MYIRELQKSEFKSLVTKDVEGPDPSGIVADLAIAILDDRNDRNILQ